MNRTDEKVASMFSDVAQDKDTVRKMCSRNSAAVENGEGHWFGTEASILPEL